MDQNLQWIDRQESSYVYNNLTIESDAVKSQKPTQIESKPFIPSKQEKTK